ncbi:MAG: hypothetical protein OQJ89_16620 [Kangiellaceae bacterium]|nr:hypothetical protein [Kangiellaceae bacterium]MCW9018599.1 hypothetical protein [Kangiellaceae bacterium]
MESISKSKLTGGTLFVIALIVLIFGNARSIEIVDKIDKTNSSLTRIESDLAVLKKQIKELKKENSELKAKQAKES